MKTVIPRPTSTVDYSGFQVPFPQIIENEKKKTTNWKSALIDVWAHVLASKSSGKSPSMVIVMILHSGGPPTPCVRGDGHTDSNDIVLLGDES